jgi:hypothetical protein
MSIRRSILAAVPVLAMAAAAASSAVAAPAPQTVHVGCMGTGQACTARISLTGGASDERVVVALPDTDLGLTSVTPSGPTLAGAYDVGDQHFRQGNSEYSIVLSAPSSAPAGSYLTFRFDAV